MYETLSYLHWLHRASPVCWCTLLGLILQNTLQKLIRIWETIQSVNVKAHLNIIGSNLPPVAAITAVTKHYQNASQKT